MARKKGLTDKRRQFIASYLCSLNASEAARQASYSPKTADKIGARLLADPEVRAEIDRLKAERVERTKVDADIVLARLWEQANADMLDIYDPVTGDLLPLDRWPEIWRTGLVAGLETGVLFEGTGKNRRHVGKVRKVRFADRIKILELIGKHTQIGAFSDRIEHSLDLNGIGDRLERSLARAAAEPRMIEAKTPVADTPSACHSHEDIESS
jgi:phage terminase small subunit